MTTRRKRRFPHLRLLMALFTLFRLSNGDGGDGGGGDGGDGGGGDGGDGGGGDGEGGAGDGGSGSDGGDGGDGGDNGKTFTQSDLTKVGTKEHRRGKNDAKKELLAELGVENLEDAKAVLDAKRKADDDRKDDLDKAKEAADKATKDAEDRVAEANRKVMMADLQLALMEPGTEEDEHPLNPAKLGPAMKLAMAFVSDFDGDPEDLVAEAVASVREDAPEFFGVTSGEPGQQGNGTPNTPGRKANERNNGNVSASDKAKSMYERHIPKPTTGGLVPSTEDQTT